MTTGKFITVEGVEGVGKSTNIALIAHEIEARGYEVHITREPGGTELGERIREILLDKSANDMTAMTELLLMFAARAQHVESVVQPKLDEGIWVVSDRFTDSSYAYQGAGRELGSAPVAALEKVVLENFKPDLTIILDADVAMGLSRAAKVGEADRIESEQLAFFERVREAFLSRADQSTSYHVVDAGESIDKVQKAVRYIIAEFIKDAR